MKILLVYFTTVLFLVELLILKVDTIKGKHDFTTTEVTSKTVHAIRGKHDLTTTEETSKTKAIGDVCEDDEKRCEYHWSRGWYTCSVGAVLYDVCRKSCGYCDKGPIPKPNRQICQDYEPECSHWAKYRECTLNRKFMKKYCQKSCKLCREDIETRKANRNCVDKHPSCKEKARKFRCYFERSFMSRNCMESCKMCAYYSACNDKDSLCGWWKRKGYCHPTSPYIGHMKKKCKYSCEMC